MERKGISDGGINLEGDIGEGAKFILFIRVKSILTMVEPSLTWTCWGSLMRANQFLQSREENWVHHEAYNSTLQMKGRRGESNTNVSFPFYVLPEMKLIVSKHNYNVLSPSSYTHISVRDLYISRIGLPILLQGNMWT